MHINGFINQETELGEAHLVPHWSTAPRGEENSALDMVWMTSENGWMTHQNWGSMLNGAPHPSLTSST